MNREETLPERVGSEWVWPDGFRLPVISGGAEDDGDDSGDADDGDDGDDGGSTDDAALKRQQRIMAKEKGQGKRQGQREVLEALGFESLDDAKKFADELKSAQDSKLDETARLTKERDDAKAEAARVRQEVARDRHNLTIEKALLKDGVDPKMTAKVARLLDIEVGSDEEEITAAIAELAEDMPQLFAEPGGNEEDDDEDGEEPARRPSLRESGGVSTDPGRGPKGKRKVSAADRAQERLRSRHGNRMKSNPS